MYSDILLLYVSGFFLLAGDSSRILYLRPKSLLPEMMNADMDGMLFSLVYVPGFVDAFGLIEPMERTERHYLECLDFAIC